MNSKLATNADASVTRAFESPVSRAEATGQELNLAWDQGYEKTHSRVFQANVCNPVMWGAAWITLLLREEELIACRDLGNSVDNCPAWEKLGPMGA